VIAAGNTSRAGRLEMKTWLNVAEGAEYAGVSRDTIYTAVNVASSDMRASLDGARSV
jgi:hypothetical protein